MNPPLSEDIRNRLLAARLPSPPQTLLRLLTLCQSEDAGIAELAALIANDPAITAKVLTVAHSAAYHRADAPPLTLLQATTRLGTAMIKVLVISETVAQTFNQFKTSGAVDLRSFWKHSLSVALMAKALAQRLGFVPVEEAYLAGLLHNIGRLALLVAVPPYQALFDAVDDSTLCEKERQLGMSHTEAGAWLLDRWHLNTPLIDSVLRHHETTVNPADTPILTRLIQLAHRLAALPLDEPDAASHLAGVEGLSAVDLLALAQNAAQQLVTMAHDLGLDISGTELPSKTGPPAAPLDAVQLQLVREVLDRSVLNEMAMTLIAQSTNEAALTQLRQHASALLQLDNVLVMLLRSSQQQLVPVSMNESHSAAAQLSFEVSQDALMTECISQRKVVFLAQDSACVTALQGILATNEMVLIPLLSARQCMGVLAAAVPADLSQHLKSQAPMLQTFGTYAGLALSRRRQVTMSPVALMAISKQEQQFGLKKMAQELSKQASTLGSVDVRVAVRDVVQRLKDSRLVPGHIKITAHLTDRVSLVRGSPGMVGLMVLILINHAFEHMANPGEIVVSAGELAYRHGASFITLAVSDSAVSSTQAIQAQLFEPPQITSDQDASCLALGGVRQWVEKIAGYLSFNSGSSGTRFDILLPSAKTTSQQA